MSTKHPAIRKLRRSANIGLYGTLLIVLLTIVEHYLSNYVWVRQIVANEYTRHLLLMVGLIVSVVDIALILFSMRKQMPRLRQLEDIDDRLTRYASIVQNGYLITLFVSMFVAAIVVITHENTLIMLMLLLGLTLMLNYPNMYKIRADLGLLDDDMLRLFGNDYISDKTSLQQSTQQQEDHLQEDYTQDNYSRIDKKVQDDEKEGNR